jgi:hypothetical protein
LILNVKFVFGAVPPVLLPVLGAVKIVPPGGGLHLDRTFAPA